jgi:hypothetical protein
MYAMYFREKSFFDSNRVTGTDGLTAAEWETALLLYNRRTPLSTEEEALFRAHDKVIIHAALHGLHYVLVYGTYQSHFGVHPITNYLQCRSSTAYRIDSSTSLAALARYYEA